MSAAETVARPCTSSDQPDVGDLQKAINALHGIFTVLDWIEHEHLGAVGDDEQGEVRVELVIAGQLITEYLRRRF
jgi:hypothetical protein